MRAEIIAIGSELLTPSRLDTNSLFITRQLNDLGLMVARKSIVGDRAEDIRDVLASALPRSEVVILIGGLGPTNDDMTREVVADALGRRLVLDEGILENLQRRYAQARLQMTVNNRRQARVIEGAEILENPNGTAPGQFLRENSTLVFLLPGPPRELQPMVMNQVLPLIRRHKPTSVQHRRQLKVASEVESRVDALIESIYKSYPQVETTILASPAIIELFFYWRGEPDDALAETQLDELAERVRARLGDSVFTDREETLEEMLGHLLVARGKTIATAESCTGGTIGKILTDVAGSSRYYVGGVVCYSNPLKIQLVGVNETTLERFGAVSEPVARQMALGIRMRTGSDFGLSLTGIAGPEGGTPEKPVGLVFVGLADAQGTRVQKLQLRGDREAIRLRAARMALDWLRRELAAGAGDVK